MVTLKSSNSLSPAKFSLSVLLIWIDTVPSLWYSTFSSLLTRFFTSLNFFPGESFWNSLLGVDDCSDVGGGCCSVSVSIASQRSATTHQTRSSASLYSSPSLSPIRCFHASSLPCMVMEGSTCHLSLSHVTQTKIS